MAYRGTEAYDFSLFEPQYIEQPKRNTPSDNGRRQNTKNNVVPARKQQPKRPQAPKRVKHEPVAKNVIELVENHGETIERNAATATIPTAVKKAIVFFVCCVVMLGVNIVLQSEYDTLTNEIATIENEIDIVEGENVRLNAELSSLIATDKIESYAENVLGMVKAENYQISYIDLSEGDQVVLSGDKTADDSNFVGKIKELAAYIF